jgi:hypothetical protein
MGIGRRDAKAAALGTTGRRFPPRALLALAVVLAAALPALAQAQQQASVTIDDRAVALENGNKGTSTADLGFTNLTDLPITLKVRPAKPDLGCDLTLSKETLPATQHTSPVTVTAPAGCSIPKDGLDMDVLTYSGSQLLHTFAVTAAPKPSTKPNWHELRAFPILLVLSLLAACGMYWAWTLLDDHRKKHSPWEPLVAFDTTTWNFKDTWVTNVTVAGGLLTAIFGATDVVKPLLGDNADSSIALATIGAAVAAAFIATGAIVLQTFKSYKHQTFTVGGLLAAAAFTLAGALGQLWIAGVTIHKLDLNGLQKTGYLWTVGIFAALLILIYASRSLLDLLKRGTKPPPATPSDGIQAAQLIAEAIAATDAPSQHEVEEKLKKEQRRKDLSETMRAGLLIAEAIVTPDEEKRRKVTEHIRRLAEEAPRHPPAITRRVDSPLAGRSAML